MSIFDIFKSAIDASRQTGPVPPPNEEVNAPPGSEALGPENEAADAPSDGGSPPDWVNYLPAPSVIRNWIARDVNLSKPDDSPIKLRDEALKQVALIRARLKYIQNDPNLTDAQRVEALQGLEPLINSFQDSADALYRIYTRSGNNEFNTFERTLDTLHKSRRQGDISHTFDATQLGLNVTSVNKIDPSYRTGTFLIGVTQYFAGVRVQQYGGMLYGLWGSATNTSVMVGGVPPGQVEAFRNQVAQDVFQFLQQAPNMNYPDRDRLRELRMHPEQASTEEARNITLLDYMGVPNMAVAELPGCKAVVDAGINEGLGMTAGYAVQEIPVGTLDINLLELRALQLLGAAAEAEKTAKFESNKVAVDTRGEPGPVRPMSESGPGLFAQLSGVQTANPAALAPDISKLEMGDAVAGKMPRPEHEGLRVVTLAQDIKIAWTQAAAVAVADPGAVKSVAGAVGAQLDAPASKSHVGVDLPNAEAVVKNTYDKILKQIKNARIYRQNFLACFASRYFKGDRFYVQLAEYRDYSGHNKRYPPNFADGVHNLTMDVILAGYTYKGLDVLVFTQGGDEVGIAYRGTLKDGRKLTPEDISRITQYVHDHFNRIFGKFIHPRSAKVPNLPGGEYRDRLYVLVDGEGGKKEVVYQGETLDPEHAFELCQHIQEGHGVGVDGLSKIRHVESLSELVGNNIEIQRWHVYEKVSADGRPPIRITLPPDATPPPGFGAQEIPLSATFSPAIEIPANSDAAVVSHAIDKTGKLADEMKAMAATRSGDKYPAVIQLGLLERLNLTPKGRFAINAGVYAGSDLISEILSGNPENVLELETYYRMLLSYPQMLATSTISEKAARETLVLIAAIKKQQLQAVKNLTTLKAAYGEATALRTAALKGGASRFVNMSSLVGTIFLMDVIANRGVNGKSLALSGTTMAAGMGARFVTLKVVEVLMEQRITALRAATVIDLTLPLTVEERRAEAVRARKAFKEMYKFKKWMASVRVVNSADHAIALLRYAKLIRAANPLVLLASAVIEQTVMKFAGQGITAFLEAQDRQAAIQQSRIDIAQAMERMDTFVMKAPLMDQNGNPNLSLMMTLRESMAQIAEAMQTQLIVTLLDSTSEGAALLEAQKGEVEARQEMVDCLKQYDWAVLKKWQAGEMSDDELGAHIRANPLPDLGGPLGEVGALSVFDLDIALGKIEESKQKVAACSQAFQNKLAAVQANDAENGVAIPFVADTSAARNYSFTPLRADSHGAVLGEYLRFIPTDPTRNMRTLMQYLETRLAWLDQRQQQGG